MRKTLKSYKNDKNKNKSNKNKSNKNYKNNITRKFLYHPNDPKKSFDVYIDKKSERYDTYKV